MLFCFSAVLMCLGIPASLLALFWKTHKKWSPAELYCTLQILSIALTTPQKFIIFQANLSNPEAFPLTRIIKSVYKVIVNDCYPCCHPFCPSNILWWTIPLCILNAFKQHNTIHCGGTYFFNTSLFKLNTFWCRCASYCKKSISLLWDRSAGVKSRNNVFNAFASSVLEEPKCSV